MPTVPWPAPPRRSRDGRESGRTASHGRWTARGLHPQASSPRETAGLAKRAVLQARVSLRVGRRARSPHRRGTSPHRQVSSGPRTAPQDKAS